MNNFLVLRPGQTVRLGSVTKEALAAGMRTHLPSFWTSGEDSFLIVEDDAERYVQLWANGPDALHVEYIEARQPFEHPDGDRTLEDTVAIFERFADGVWPPFDGAVPVTPFSAEDFRPAGFSWKIFTVQVLVFLLVLLYFVLTNLKD